MECSPQYSFGCRRQKLTPGSLGKRSLLCGCNVKHGLRETRRMPDPEVVPSSALSILFYILHRSLSACPSHPHPFTFQCTCVLPVGSLVTCTDHSAHRIPILEVIPDWLKSFCHFVQTLERKNMTDLCPMSRLAHF